MNSVLQQFDVSGRSVFVTGGGSGIGLACAEALAECGARVTLAARTESAVEREAKRLRERGWEVRAARVDVARPDEVALAFASHVAAFGDIDAVFANAGVDGGPGFWNSATASRDPAGQVDSLDRAHWRRAMDVNLDGAFYTISQAARVMKAAGRPGSIIVTSSIASAKVFANLGSPYMAAKAGITHFVKQIALELAEYKIRVNSIAPGLFVTNIGGGVLADPAVRAAWATIVPLGHMAETEQMKPLALFLASDASSFVTGTEIVIDGGVSLGNFR